MPAIYLVRHGQASFGTDDYDVLSDLGVMQAAVAGRELARRAPRDPLLVSGSLSRQQGTAAEIARELGISDIQTDDRWNEIDAHGIVDAELGRAGASADLTSAAFQEVLDAALVTMIDVGDQRWQEFSARVNDGLVAVTSSVPRGRDAIVVTSAAVIATVASGLMTGSGQAVVSLNRVSVNAAISTLAASARRTSLITFNDHAHLIGEPGLVTYR